MQFKKRVTQTSTSLQDSGTPLGSSSFIKKEKIKKEQLSPLEQYKNKEETSKSIKIIKRNYFYAFFCIQIIQIVFFLFLTNPKENKTQKFNTNNLIPIKIKTKSVNIRPNQEQKVQIYNLKNNIKLTDIVYNKEISSLESNDFLSDQSEKYFVVTLYLDHQQFNKIQNHLDKSFSILPNNLELHTRSPRTREKGNQYEIKI